MTTPDTPSEVMDRALAAAHDATFKALTRYERIPFRRVLADMLGCAPTVDALRAFAEKSPDRWAQAVSIMAGLAGFDRGVGATVNIYNVEGMSDAVLMARIRELDRLAAARDVTPPAGSPDHIPEIGTNGPVLGMSGGEDAGHRLPPAADLQGVGGATELPQPAGSVARDIPEREQNLGSYAEVPTLIPNGNEAAAGGGPPLPVGPPALEIPQAPPEAAAAGELQTPVDQMAAVPSFIRLPAGQPEWGRSAAKSEEAA